MGFRVKVKEASLVMGQGHWFLISKEKLLEQTPAKAKLYKKVRRHGWSLLQPSQQLMEKQAFQSFVINCH